MTTTTGGEAGAATGGEQDAPGVISFLVPGDPVPKGRPRFGNGRTYTPAKTLAYEDLVAMIARGVMRGRPLMQGPVAMLIRATFAFPKSWPVQRRIEGASHVTRPDADNIAKIVGDALNGVVFKDDCQIADLKVAKRWGPVGALVVTIKNDLEQE